MAGQVQERSAQATGGAMALLRFSDVALVRGGRLLFEALGLTLGPGEGLHVAGPNGSGKSSLIRLAAGLLRPATGDVQRARAALADDALALDPELPLGRALAFWGAEVEPAMNALGIGRLAQVPVRLLSSGQQKRATLARVAASGAPLWLLDEPLNALDAPAQAALRAVLATHLASGGLAIAATHAALEMAGARVLELGA